MADKKISALTDASTPLAGTEVLPIVQSGSTVKVSAADITAGRDVTAKSLVLTQTTSGVSGWQIAGNFRAASYPMFRMSATGSNKVGSVGNDNDGSFTFLVNGTATAIGTQSFTLSAAGNVTANVGNVVIGTAGKGIDFSANTHAAGMTSELLTWYEEGTWTPVVVPAPAQLLRKRVLVYTRELADLYKFSFRLSLTMLELRLQYRQFLGFHLRLQIRTRKVQAQLLKKGLQETHGHLE